MERSLGADSAGNAKRGGTISVILQFKEVLIHAPVRFVGIGEENLVRRKLGPSRCAKVEASRRSFSRRVMRTVQIDFFRSLESHVVQASPGIELKHSEEVGHGFDIVDGMLNVAGGAYPFAQEVPVPKDEAA